MPLREGTSRSDTEANIKELIGTGKYPRRQAVAIALSKRREAMRKRGKK